MIVPDRQAQVESKLETEENNTENGTATSNTSSSGVENDVVAELKATLGEDVVLIPVARGDKRPINVGWQNITVEQTNTPEYQEQLRRSNIGVSLGRPSSGLCAIDIDVDDRLEGFLNLNPRLRATLITKGNRGAQMWMRIDGEYPASTKLKDGLGSEIGEWRAGGNQSVIHGLHPAGMSYSRLNNAQPIQIEFKDVKWPDDLVLSWKKGDYDKVVKEHGRPFTLSAKGVLRINDYFFVSRFLHEHLLVWEQLEEEFYEYNEANGLWEIANEDKVKWQFGLDLKRAADEVGVEDFIWVRKSGMLSSMVAMLRGLAGENEPFKKGNRFIHLTNGMLDLRADHPSLMSFHPDYYSRNICPLSLNPEAECPRFINELLRTALDEDDIELLQKWAGCVLLGNNSAQRILLLIGTPNGGKSTLIEIIEKIIGEQNVAQIRTKHLNKQFELYKFLGKTLLTGKDVGATFLNEDGAELLKALVGNDMLDAEKKHGSDQFQLRGNFNMAITCNSKLHVKLEGDAGAWQRRLMIINYSKPKPKERIVEFADKLIKAEGPGILNWMIEGAIRYLDEVDRFGDYQLTDDQKERVDVLLSESDSVRQFVLERVHVQQGDSLTVVELQQYYFQYCEDLGWRAFSPQDFRSSITDLMLEIHHVGKRNDITRGLTAHRGFKNVSIIGGLR
jgi:P4 family phage/plasmid primase-like protien